MFIYVLITCLALLSNTINVVQCVPATHGSSTKVYGSYHPQHHKKHKKFIHKRKKTPVEVEKEADSSGSSSSSQYIYYRKGAPVMTNAVKLYRTF